MNQELLQRFWDKVEFTTDCWEWKARTDRDGYGRFRHFEKQVFAHRFSLSLYEKLNSDLVVDHICNNKKCVNPAHLRQVTSKVNILRGTAPTAKNAIKTTCIHGHRLDDENTYVCTDGKRMCKKCNNNASLKYGETEKRIEYLKQWNHNKYQITKFFTTIKNNFCNLRFT